MDAFDFDDDNMLELYRELAEFNASYDAQGMHGMPDESSSLDVVGLSSDNFDHPYSLPTHPSRSTMSNDTTPYAALTPSSSGDNSNASPAHSPLPDLASRAPSASAPARRPSNGPRVLVPQASSVSSRGSLSNTVSAPQDAGPSPSGGGGPTGKMYTIPPRPKPGRKAATNEAPSKRKAQNRMSQRAFRARKAARVEELANTVQANEQTHKIEVSAHLQTIARLQSEVRDLQSMVANLAAERTYWRDHFNNLTDSNTRAATQPEMQNPFNQNMLYQVNANPLADGRHDSPSRRSTSSAHAYGTPTTTEPLGCDKCEPDNCACLAGIANDMAFQANLYPPMDAVPLPPRSNGVSPMTGIERSGQAKSTVDFTAHEIDFTTKFQTQRPQPTLMPSNDMTKIQDCGWCEEHPEYCLCKDASLRPDGEDGMAPLSQVTSRSSMDDIKPVSTMSGPGSCADCQSNPRQRAWCQRISQLRGEATPPRSRRNSNKSTTPDVLEPRTETSIENNTACSSPVAGKGSIGCSDAFKLLDGRMDVDHMDWRNLKPVPTSVPQNLRRDTFTMEPGTYSAMELDASSILTTLQHSRRPLEPRPSDGRLAPLIREAEDRRRATLSPMRGPEDHGR